MNGSLLQDLRYCHNWSEVRDATNPNFPYRIVRVHTLPLQMCQLRKSYTSLTPIPNTELIATLKIKL
jgi:hypothetical protein